MNRDKPAFSIDLDKKCSRCGKGGVFGESGLCLPCINKGIQRGDYDALVKEIKADMNSP